jgi:thiol-disulfide isomerase/thioredoxin
MASARSTTGTIHAPEFPPLEWLNTDRPISLAGLRGKIVLLDFWTYGCINCMHIIPDLKRLEDKYPDELVVIGVHSAKFRNEGDTENLRQIVLRYELEHPVINDRDFLVWRAYGARAWPTLVLIDPEGRVVGKHSGEDVFEPFDKVIGAMVIEFDAKGLIDRRALQFKLEQEGLPETALSFPGKLLVDESARRLFIADSNHNRLVVADLDSYRVTQVIGGPEPGFRDGGAMSARFHHPQGMALHPDGRRLYLADTENHALRLLDLDAHTVTTFAGTGEQSSVYPGRAGRGHETQLNSPWDLTLVDHYLFIAMAGSHQLWVMDLDTGMVGPWAGSGREGIDDGSAGDATLAQPSGLTTDGRWLYFTDPEASAIRAASLRDGRIRTLVGTGLFDFGDVDGVGRDARLQHSLGIAYREADGLLYVADTYNSKIKTVHTVSAEVRTLLGSAHGYRDGTDPLFYEPGGLAIAGDRLYVADTNNHAVRVVDLVTLDTRTVVLRDVRALLAPSGGEVDETLELAPRAMRSGEAVLRLGITFPSGRHPDDLTPLAVNLETNPVMSFPGGRRRRRLVGGRFPVDIPVQLRPGQATVEADITIPYCEDDDAASLPGTIAGTGLCATRTIKVRMPLTVAADGDTVLPIGYTFPEVERP